MARPKAKSGWYIANTSFLAPGSVTVTKDVTRAFEGSDILKGRENLFTAIEDLPHHAPRRAAAPPPVVEQATAEPGTSRR